MNKNKGFSILEVTIALGILSVGSLGLIGLTTNQTNAHKRTLNSQNFHTLVSAVKLTLGDQVGCTKNLENLPLPLINTTSAADLLNIYSAGIDLNTYKIYPKSFNKTGPVWDPAAVGFFKPYTLGGAPVPGAFASDYINQGQELVATKAYLNKFIGTHNGANSTYFATMVIESDKKSLLSVPALARYFSQQVIVEGFPLRLVVDETKTPPQITSCDGFDKNYVSPGPYITMDGCRRDDLDAGSNNGLSWHYCPPPEVLIDMQPDASAFGHGNYFRCCTPTVHNLPMQDGTVKAPVGSPGFPLAGDPSLPPTDPDYVRTPSDCSVIDQCSYDGSNSLSCCVGKNPTHRLGTTSSSVWVGSSFEKDRTGSSGNLRWDDYFRDIELKLPSGADPTFRLTLTDCTGSTDMASFTGWLGPTVYSTNTFPQNPQNQVIVDLMQTQGNCNGGCFPIFCKLGIVGQ